MLLETERLQIRDFTLQDLDGLWALDRDPDVMRFIGPPSTWTKSETGEAIERAHRYYSMFPGLGVWATIERRSGSFVGWTALKHLGPLKELMATGEVHQVRDIEIGYRYHRAYWGRGYATEAAQAVLRHAFTAAKLPRVVAIAHPENAASIRVLEKIGLEREGRGAFRGIEVERFALDRP